MGADLARRYLPRSLGGTNILKQTIIRICALAAAVALAAGLTACGGAASSGSASSSPASLSLIHI